MDTLQALQTIDDGKFEILVTNYLPHYDSRLYGIIATGINEKGKPIPCPVDNIVYIPGDPPHCVTVASTTTEKDLRRKWLGGKNYQGDIEKAKQVVSLGFRKIKAVMLGLVTRHDQVKDRQAAQFVWERADFI